MSSFYESNRGYFDMRMQSAQLYLKRFPHGIDFTGKRVLDVGCGHGALSVIAAKGGASEVVGVDLVEKLVDFAIENQSKRFAETIGTLRFETHDLLDGGLHDFDIVVSEDTFEHIVGLETYLGKIKEVLRNKGRLYVGYSPLYNAARGDHNRLKAPLSKYFPWMHLLLPKKWLLKRISEIEGHSITSLADLGLNGLSFAKHKQILHGAGMDVIYFQANNQTRKLAQIIELVRWLPGLSELLSYSISAILEKNDGSESTEKCQL